VESTSTTDVVNGHVRIVRLKQRKNPILNVQPLAAIERVLVERLAGQAGTGRLFPWSPSYTSRIIKTYLVASGRSHAANRFIRCGTVLDMNFIRLPKIFWLSAGISGTDPHPHRKDTFTNQRLRST
jgi:hypothetical protein